MFSKKMQLAQSLFSVVVLVPFLVLYGCPETVQALSVELRTLENQEKLNVLVKKDEINHGERQTQGRSQLEEFYGGGSDDDILEETDFQDDEEEEEQKNWNDANAPSVYSVTHLHRLNGEILIPCFGMWWPVGGTGGGAYDYGVDYYGDYRKKRRRSRKQKKAARMKKKKA